MPRFLHTVDWQIDRQYGCFAEQNASILANARFDAIERLAGLASSEHVDAVLVAGDVFDAQTVSDRTLHRCFQAMAGYICSSAITKPANPPSWAPFVPPFRASQVQSRAGTATVGRLCRHTGSRAGVCVAGHAVATQ